jgi:hypothetical protein
MIPVWVVLVSIDSIRYTAYDCAMLGIPDRRPEEASIG